MTALSSHGPFHTKDIRNQSCQTFSKLISVGSGNSPMGPGVWVEPANWIGRVPLRGDSCVPLD